MQLPTSGGGIVGMDAGRLRCLHCCRGRVCADCTSAYSAMQRRPGEPELSGNKVKVVRNCSPLIRGATKDLKDVFVDVWELGEIDGVVRMGAFCGAKSGDCG